MLVSPREFAVGTNLCIQGGDRMSLIATNLWSLAVRCVGAVARAGGRFFAIMMHLAAVDRNCRLRFELGRTVELAIEAQLSPDHYIGHIVLLYSTASRW